MGLLETDMQYEHVRSFITSLTHIDPAAVDRLDTLVEELVGHCRRDLENDGGAAGTPELPAGRGMPLPRPGVRAPGGDPGGPPRDGRRRPHRRELQRPAPPRLRLRLRRHGGGADHGAGHRGRTGSSRFGSGAWSRRTALPTTRRFSTRGRPPSTTARPPTRRATTAASSRPGTGWRGPAVVIQHNSTVLVPPRLRGGGERIRQPARAPDLIGRRTEAAPPERKGATHD